MPIPDDFVRPLDEILALRKTRPGCRHMIAPSWVRRDQFANCGLQPCLCRRDEFAEFLRAGPTEEQINE